MPPSSSPKSPAAFSNDAGAAQEHVAAERDQPGEEPLHEHRRGQAPAQPHADIHAAERRNECEERSTGSVGAVLALREKREADRERTDEREDADALHQLLAAHPERREAGHPRDDEHAGGAAQNAGDEPDQRRQPALGGYADFEPSGEEPISAVRSE